MCLACLHELGAQDAALVGLEELGAEGQNPYPASYRWLGYGVKVREVVDKEGELERCLGVHCRHVLCRCGEDLTCMPFILALALSLSLSLALALSLSLALSLALAMQSYS